MIAVNLLPWRQEARERAQKKYQKIIKINIVIIFIVLVIVHYLLATLEKKGTAENLFLGSQLQQLDKKILKIKENNFRKELLLSRIKIIHNLSNNILLNLHFFDEINKTVPLGIYLSKITRKGGFISIDGYSQSPIFVSELMRKIASNNWFNRPNLIEIRTISKNIEGRKTGRQKFKINFLFQPKNRVT